jgi:hypothetical protein
MVATVRCEEIANENLKQFLSDKVEMFLCHSILLHPSQIIIHYDFSRYIAFSMFIDIIYIHVHREKLCI